MTDVESQEDKLRKLREEEAALEAALQRKAKSLGLGWPYASAAEPPDDVDAATTTDSQAPGDAATNVGHDRSGVGTPAAEVDTPSDGCPVQREDFNKGNLTPLLTRWVEWRYRGQKVPAIGPNTLTSADGPSCGFPASTKRRSSASPHGSPTTRRADEVRKNPQPVRNIRSIFPQ